ncbi:MAG: hypothetical protein V3U20_03805 [Thermoplasmata archaeon]
MDYWGVDILVLVLLIILLLIFIALPLYFTARILDEDEGLLVALGTTILLLISFSACITVLGWVGLCLVGLIVAIAVNLLIIKLIYDTDWGKAFIMWIVAIIMSVIITVIMMFLVGLSLIFW